MEKKNHKRTRSTMNMINNLESECFQVFYRTNDIFSAIHNIHGNKFKIAAINKYMHVAELTIDTLDGDVGSFITSEKYVTVLVSTIMIISSCDVNVLVNMQGCTARQSHNGFN